MEVTQNFCSLSKQRTLYTAQAPLASVAESTGGPSFCTARQIREPALNGSPADNFGGTLRLPAYGQQL